MPEQTMKGSYGLVLRFRSSHHFAADSSANFGIKGALAISMLSSAVFGFEVPTRACCKLIGTSNPPHLVLRFRSSHHFPADSGANFGIKGAALARGGYFRLDANRYRLPSQGHRIP